MKKVITKSKALTSSKESTLKKTAEKQEKEQASVTAPAPSTEQVPAKQENPEKEEKPKKTCGAKSASVTANCTATKEEISRIVMESFQYFNREPVKTNEECAERLNAYFSQCSTTGQIPTVEDMALALGVTRWTLLDWEKECVKNPVRSSMIKKAKQILAGIDAKLVSEHKIPQITYIFRAKNFFGMRDQQEVVLTPNKSPLGDGGDAETIKNKYIESAYKNSNVIEEKDKQTDVNKSIKKVDKVKID